MLQLDLCDAVVVGGVDTLCEMTLQGFGALEALAGDHCAPFTADRDGINIGESCGYALLARDDLVDDADFVLLGYGESADAYHMSHPHPEGKGALLAMTQALQRAELDARDVDYINLHGTASQANDRIEAHALGQLRSEERRVGKECRSRWSPYH